MQDLTEMTMFYGQYQDTKVRIGNRETGELALDRWGILEPQHNWVGESAAASLIFESVEALDAHYRFLQGRADALSPVDALYFADRRKPEEISIPMSTWLDPLR
jgi:hypothetical protein